MSAQESQSVNTTQEMTRTQSLGAQTSGGAKAYKSCSEICIYAGTALRAER